METIPRRINLELNTAAELAIFNAIQEVEKIGADPILTDIELMLIEAKNKLSDYIDQNN
jgi:hypothetical protein